MPQIPVLQALLLADYQITNSNTRKRRETTCHINYVQYVCSHPLVLILIQVQYHLPLFKGGRS